MSSDKSAGVPARFNVGDRVRVRELPNLFYSRTQMFVRGVTGTIAARTYEDLTPEAFEKIIDALARGEKPKTGPQIDRRSSEPVTGERTLTNPDLFDGSMIGKGAGLAAAREAVTAREAGEKAPKPPEPAAAAAPPAPPKSENAPAKPPAHDAVKAAGEADSGKAKSDGKAKSE